MTKILMVCLGNICRSPLAEGILQYRANQLGADVQVDSAGTSAYHIGEHPDSRMIQTASHHGIDLSSQCARQFSAADFNRFDRIYAMDNSNYADILSLARNNEDRQKVELLLNASHPNSDMSVPDPWYGGDEGFERVFELVDEACEKIAGTL